MTIMVTSSLRALALFEAALGPTHPQAITSRQNYAQLLREGRRQAKAAALEPHVKHAPLASPPSQKGVRGHDRA